MQHAVHRLSSVLAGSLPVVAVGAAPRPGRIVDGGDSASRRHPQSARLAELRLHADLCLGAGRIARQGGGLAVAVAIASAFAPTTA